MSRTLETRRIGGDGLTCNQVLYHVQERAIEHAVLPWCERHGVAVVGYSPFGQRDFPNPRTPAGRVLAKVGEAHGATSRQVALAFLTRLTDGIRHSESLPARTRGRECSGGEPEALAGRDRSARPRFSARCSAALVTHALAVSFQ